jgi:hypothetical protein
METRFFIDLHGQLLQRQTVPMSSRRNSGMLSQVQKGRENSDNNPCSLYNWGDFCTGPEGVLSTVLQCTTFLLLLLLLFFFSLLTNSLEKNFQQNQTVQVLNFSFLYYRQCGNISLSTRTLLLPRSYPHYSYTEAS